MKGRKAAIKFIREQLELDKEDRFPVPKEKPCCFHYGRVELSQLIDFIYGEENENKRKRQDPSTHTNSRGPGAVIIEGS